MCDNKVSGFNKIDMSQKISTKISKTVNIKNNIDKFYDNRKILFDICGNIINKDKYPFINILSTYLVDIVNSIDIEINKSTRNSMINWREKKNPKLLSKFINNDDNINIINRSMNKITSSNYMTIVTEISDALMQDNFRKLPEYCKYLFDTIIKKCLNDENFVKDYLHFLVAFKAVIKTNINEYINIFITEILSVLNKNNSLVNNVNTSYSLFIKDISQYYNIGIIFANLYIIKNDNSLSNNIILYNFTEVIFYEKFMCCIHHINNFLEWLPVDMADLNGRIYLIFGIVEILGNKLFEIMTENDKNIFNDILTLIYNFNNIPNKIKFKVLDIQDMIKKFEKNKQNDIDNYNYKNKLAFNAVDSISKNTYSNYDNTDNNDIVEYKEPVIVEKKIYKPLNYSSLKLVQMKNSNNTPTPTPITPTPTDTTTPINEFLITQLPTPVPVTINLPSIPIETPKSEVINSEQKYYKPNQNYKKIYKEQKQDTNYEVDKTNKTYNKNNNNNYNNYNNNNYNKNKNNNNLQVKNSNDDNSNNDYNDDNMSNDGFTKVERKKK